jgi:hypothetical protein
MLGVGWAFQLLAADRPRLRNHSVSTTLVVYRYDFGGTVMPALRDWMREERGVNFDEQSASQAEFYDDVAAPTVVDAFVADIEGKHGGFSITAEDRVYRSHGQTCQEIYNLRYGWFLFPVI